MTELVTLTPNGLGNIPWPALLFASTRSALGSQLVDGLPRLVYESGHEGLFVFNSANLAAFVTEQPDNYIPPSGQNGASGAWVRKTLPVDLSNQITLGNPTIAGGLSGLAPDGLGTLANRREYYTLSGSRTAPVVGRSIEISDGQTGPASSAGASTANSASYGLSIVGVRPSWNTSSITGELDAINIFLRQSNSDTAALLSNIGVRSGFAAFAETYTFSADATGAAIKAVRTQIGVVNPRDGGEYAFAAIASTGTIAAAFQASLSTGSSFTDAFAFFNSSGGYIARIRGSDGTFLGGTVAPIVDIGGDVGAPSLRYDQVFSRQWNVTELAAASVPTPAAGTQNLFIDTADHKLKRKDSTGAVTVIA